MYLKIIYWILGNLFTCAVTCVGCYFLFSNNLETNVTTTDNSTVMCKRPVLRSQLSEFFESNCTEFDYAAIILAQSHGPDSEYKFPKNFDRQNIFKFIRDANDVFQVNNVDSPRRLIVTQKSDGKHTLDLGNGTAYYVYFASPEEIVEITKMVQDIRHRGLDLNIEYIDNNFKEKIKKIMIDSLQENEVVIGKNGKSMKYLNINEIEKFMGKFFIFDVMKESDLIQIPESIYNDADFQSKAIKNIVKLDKDEFPMLVIEDKKLKIVKQPIKDAKIEDIVKHNILCPICTLERLVVFFNVEKESKEGFSYQDDKSLQQILFFLLKLTGDLENKQCTDQNLLTKFLQRFNIEFNDELRYCGYKNSEIVCAISKNTFVKNGGSICSKLTN